MSRLPEVIAALEAIAPLRLAADWDAVGLLVSPRRPEVTRIRTCLTLTPEVAAEAVAARADLVVTHHPLPFRPVPRITRETGPGRVLLELIAAGIGVWSSHTAWDSAAGGINAQLALLLGLVAVAPIEPDAADPQVGCGRCGQAAAGTTVALVAEQLASQLSASAVQVVGEPERPAGLVGIICGSGGGFIGQAAAAGCTTFVTGELKLHEAVEARAAGLAVVAVGHHASEHFAMAELARRLTEALPGVDVRPAEDDRDPISWLKIRPAARL
jgi:dinuclear metal center YbgI/SA1388 family protein